MKRLIITLAMALLLTLATAGPAFAGEHGDQDTTVVGGDEDTTQLNLDNPGQPPEQEDGAACPPGVGCLG